jgi:two-component system response regulator PilR (NtrC family)
MNSYSALIVDDEPDICELLQLTLSGMDIQSRAASNLSEAHELLRTDRFDICLTDMRLPDGNGIELVEFIQQEHSTLPVAVITAHGNMESAIQALKAGAFDYVSKPVDLPLLRQLVNSALALASKSADAETSVKLVGNSVALKKVSETINKLARSQAPVYISGESGCGKELAARLIHEKGPRASKPFVPVNCGAIPDDLMESEFFGHVKGSFTGAVSDKNGLFQAANEGTLFLDEVAELPLHMQVKLLRAIQEKTVRPVGAQKEIPIDVRILAATHQDLKALVSDGRFRKDLYYRINVIELHIPSLKERSEDIPALAEHILQKLSVETGVLQPVLSAGAIDALKEYPFPGNVRELENILERAMTLCEHNEITADDLGLPEVHTADGGITADSMPLDEHLNMLEKKKIQEALERCRYNKTRAAELLGISFRQLRYRLKKLGLE